MLSTAATRALTGCDLQRVDEVEAAVHAFGDRYLDRVYTAVEQRSYRTGGAASLAGRFAAKEAVLKLVGSPDGIDLRTVEIAVDDTGRPEVHLTGAIAEAARRVSLGPIDVSVSHAGGLALAVAVAMAGEAPAPHPAPAVDPGNEENR